MLFPWSKESYSSVENCSVLLINVFLPLRAISQPFLFIHTRREVAAEVLNAKEDEVLSPAVRAGEQTL